MYFLYKLCSIKWGIFNFIKGWTILTNCKLQYVFHNLKFRSHYGTAHTDESVYIIGGLADFTISILSNAAASKTSTIAEYKNDVWTKIGSLKQARESHGAITVRGRTLIIGGLPNIDNADLTLLDLRIDTEIWDLGSSETQIMNPTLTNYIGGGFFEVQAGFCSRNWSPIPRYKFLNYKKQVSSSRF